MCILKTEPSKANSVPDPSGWPKPASWPTGTLYNELMLDQCAAMTFWYPYMEECLGGSMKELVWRYYRLSLSRSAGWCWLAAGLSLSCVSATGWPLQSLDCNQRACCCQYNQITQTLAYTHLWSQYSNVPYANVSKDKLNMPFYL